MNLPFSNIFTYKWKCTYLYIFVRFPKTLYTMRHKDENIKLMSNIYRYGTQATPCEYTRRRFLVKPLHARSNQLCQFTKADPHTRAEILNGVVKDTCSSSRDNTSARAVTVTAFCFYLRTSDTHIYFPIKIRNPTKY